MPPPPTPQLVLGPYYFGVALNTFLYGVLFLQILIYFQGYKRDQFWLRLFVLYLFFVETVNTGICVAMIYEPLIGQFGTDGPISLFPTLLAGQPFLEIAISAPVQFFYAWRIRVIMKRDWIPALICLSSLASTAGAIWTGICVHQAHIYQNKDIINHPALIWSICSAGSDVIISTTLITVLIKRKTGIKTTDDTVNRIIRTTVQTGAITGSFAVLDIVLFLALPNSTLSFTFDFALPKLYSNALVSTLNARAGMVQLSLRQPQDNVLFSEQPLGSSVGQSNAAETSTFNGPIVFNASPNLDYIEMNSVTLNGDTGIGYAGNLSKARVP
ncbi:hypothetical protein GYMLUDRAFT_227974 [Collybiopsis luxurians FD-317 M1]|uniref:Unplaced genomic scaffold GYMLUscaffold_37, whole genome shotgun sequence n=1 Tax=Collybiopsis luxurians FD-317 M1 TaxID=944289 RepID=A0A0D0CJ42_9AGAR|nr:hypothetical protein GYMLUDRAFT_227974 [Collybiopsis luxurians FD-317 M1]